MPTLLHPEGVYIGQKPWINGDVHAKLKARTDAYISGDLEEYRKSRYALRSAISSAKRHYRDKVESHYKGSNTRNMWAGLKTISDYKAKTSSADVVSASLPEDLNTFYARFERNSPAVEIQEDRCPPVISRADVWRSLNRINTRKAPGPDGIPGRALKVCADQLADVFTDIFNLLTPQCERRGHTGGGSANSPASSCLAVHTPKPSLQIANRPQLCEQPN
ncbi:uncharacterized protein LOC117769796 [Hippoglossus hippoglossus]|uniref:uncharacterized protein LOC117769796 n=1 Tax=Hippoglossus hippoglossus TaxID=8267 RepID=UPI00148CCF00|nr:uncharacterized protein LOC117769796 [Hippoglossus hippoglossus]